MSLDTPRVDRSGELWWLGNGFVRLGCAPALGGRLLSLSTADGPEMLWHNPKLLTGELTPRQPHRPHGGEMGDWLNYGGDKTWPAPQGWSAAGEWAGPPDPVLDSGPYQVATEQTPELAAITMTSGDDPRTGLRLTRRFELRAGRSGYHLTLTGENTSGRTVRWALWNVTQLAAGDTWVDGPAQVTDLLAGTGFPRWQAESGRVRVPHQEVVGKLGFPAAIGRVTHTGESGTWTTSFAVNDTAEYPDGGSRVEVWLEHPLPRPLAALGNLNPPAHIVECEVLGPLTELAPGERMTLTLDCTITGKEGR
jgi:hypothetical protein